MWRNVLGLRPGDDSAAARKRYLRLALQQHPNKGGNTAAFQRLQAAWTQAQRHYARPSSSSRASRPSNNGSRKRAPSPYPRWPPPRTGPPPSNNGSIIRVQVLCVDEPALSMVLTLPRRSSVQVLYRRIAFMLDLRGPFSLDWNGPGGATANHLRRPNSMIDTPPVIRLRIRPRPGAAAFPWPETKK